MGIWCAILSFTQEFNGAITAVSTLVIAFFTGLLVRVSMRQANIAKSAIDIELPNFIIEDAKLIRDNGTHIRIGIKAGNHGRTAAFIDAFCMEIKFAKRDDMPKKPIYPKVPYTPDRERIINQGHSFDFENDALIEPEIRAVWNTTGAGALWVWGYIDYIDFMDKAHRRGYCIAFLPGPFGGWIWARPEREHYNYSCYKKNRDEY